MLKPSLALAFFASVIALGSGCDITLGSSGNSGGNPGSTTSSSNTSAADSYSVTYSGNGSTGGTAPADPSSPYASGATVTVLGNAGSLVDTGLYFAGWNTAPDGSGTAYTQGATFKASANVTLYAQWSSTAYHVHLSLTGNAGILLLQLNGGETNLQGNLNTWSSQPPVFTQTDLAPGTPYSVTILGQPSNAGQTCTLSGASGTISDADVTVAVTCALSGNDIYAVTCPGSGTTSISGKVLTPGGDPVPGALVYLPGAAVPSFTPGVAPLPCSSLPYPTEIPVAPPSTYGWTISAVDGSFTLVNAPVGASHALVIQLGRWRVQSQIPMISSCVNTALSAALTTLPGTQSQGDIPQFAVATGSDDPLECVLRKMGIADTEFTAPSGGGRVHLYANTGSAPSGGAPSYTALVGSSSTLADYDAVLLGCPGNSNAQSSGNQDNLISYAGQGGRLYLSHFSYTWLNDASPFSGTATWTPDPSVTGETASDTGLIDTTDAWGSGPFAQWLKLIFTSSTLGQFPIDTSFDDFSAVAASSRRVLYDASHPISYSFNAPVGSAAASQQGSVTFSDFHAHPNQNPGATFPGECDSSTMTEQERATEAMLLYTVGGCVGQ